MSAFLPAPPASLKAYRLAWRAGAPLVRRHLKRRARRGKEDRLRLPERYGRSTRRRPKGTLMWFHAASIGESLSVLPLLDALLEAHPDASAMVTTGTVTSAAILKDRLPPRAFHHFAPIDSLSSVTRFLDHFWPDAAFWLESELWPTLIWETRRRGIPMALVNGRMSASSFRGWRWFPKTIAALLDCFDLCLAQDAVHAGRFQNLGATNVQVVGNLKRVAKPLTSDAAALADMESQVGRRPVWLAASIHWGEDDMVGAVHEQVREALASVLTIAVPRHPERAVAMAERLAGRGLNVARRSLGEPIRETTDIYLADTVGELGLFYRLAPVAFVGGSLVPHGGQNPLEPARLGAAIIHGPDIFNFESTYGDLQSHGAAVAVRDAEELRAAVARLIGDGKARARMAEAAEQVVAQTENILPRTAALLGPLIGAAAKRMTR